MANGRPSAEDLSERLEAVRVSLHSLREELAYLAEDDTSSDESSSSQAQPPETSTQDAADTNSAPVVQNSPSNQSHSPANLPSAESPAPGQSPPSPEPSPGSVGNGPDENLFLPILSTPVFTILSLLYS